jgi:ribosomal protein S24E
MSTYYNAHEVIAAKIREDNRQRMERERVLVKLYTRYGELVTDGRRKIYQALERLQDVIEYDREYDRRR